MSKSVDSAFLSFIKILVMCVSKRHLYLSLGTGIDRFSKQNILVWCTRASTVPIGSAVEGVVLRPLFCWDYEFEFRQWHGELSLGNAVFCQVYVSVSGWSLVQRSRTERRVSECDHETSNRRSSWPLGVVVPEQNRCI
jgi:hypothetical protein